MFYRRIFCISGNLHYTGGTCIWLGKWRKSRRAKRVCKYYIDVCQYGCRRGHFRGHRFFCAGENTGVSAGRNSYTSLYKGVVTNDKAGRWQNVSKETLHKMIMGNYTQDLGRNFFGGVGDYMYDMGKELYQIDGYYGKARDNLYRFSRIVGSIE